MESAVEFYFSVLAVVIAISGIFTVLEMNEEDTEFQALKNSLSMLGDQCEQVCNMAEGTRLPVEVTLVPEVILRGYAHRLCMSYYDRIRCTQCPCRVHNYTLALNTSLARSMGEHSYECMFIRAAEAIELECQG